MATIGTFTQIDNGSFTGEIVTLTIQAKKVTIARVNSDGENAPTHRVYLGKAEIGAGWGKESKEGRRYISIKLDDPSLPAPIFANLFDDEDGKGYSLIWTRSNGKRS